MSMNLHKALIANEIFGDGGSGGGGGSSDFSTAEVTFTNPSSAYEAIVRVACAYDYSEDEYEEHASSYSFSVGSDGVTAEIILYKGTAYCEIEHGTVVSCSGDITNNYGMLEITGDGSVALNGEAAPYVTKVGTVTFSTNSPVEVIGGIWFDGVNFSSSVSIDTAGKTLDLYCQYSAKICIIRNGTRNFVNETECVATGSVTGGNPYTVSGNATFAITIS